MKKFLILLLAMFVCFNAEATIRMAHSTLPAKVAAANAARRQKERLEEKQQHEEEFHHGDLVYEVSSIREVFVVEDSVFTIETYEIRKYYYEIDPDKCAIKEETILKSSRPATEQEIKERQKMIDFVFVLVGTTLVITIISIILIIYQERKKKLSIGYKEI